MNTINRRNALKALVGGAAAAGLAMSLLPSAVEAAPLALEKALPKKLEPLVENAQMGPPPGRRRPPPPPPRWRRRRRRWVCWWRRGRRVCGWRYW